ncbi:MAG: hypothetical protein U0401_10525 [Anaerolineae bacterium]
MAASEPADCPGPLHWRIGAPDRVLVQRHGRPVSIGHIERLSQQVGSQAEGMLLLELLPAGGGPVSVVRMKPFPS